MSSQLDPSVPPHAPLAAVLRAATAPAHFEELLGEGAAATAFLAAAPLPRRPSLFLTKSLITKLAILLTATGSTGVVLAASSGVLPWSTTPTVPPVTSTPVAPSTPPAVTTTSSTVSVPTPPCPDCSVRSDHPPPERPSTSGTFEPPGSPSSAKGKGTRSTTEQSRARAPASPTSGPAGPSGAAKKTQDH